MQVRASANCFPGNNEISANVAKENNNPKENPQFETKHGFYSLQDQITLPRMLKAEGKTQYEVLRKSV